MILRLRPVFLKAPLLAALLGAGLQLARDTEMDV